ncbi:putative histidine kinase group protein [Apodospora peruviana]|uniref:Histidine kinase group protein n=1 Tax=Apodospora peruviana TaxID=516989 RepID=A0AAE0I471_9PEZI|nr:putative histidine kinase group protein [Apodospora peruviana]
MPKKKKGASKEEIDTTNAANANASSSAPAVMPSPTTLVAPSITKKTPKPKPGAQQQQQQSSPALIICRNKHWRYISSFHGPWLQLPHEILETLANINYNTPRPRPIDPAVFFDLAKIRKLVDDATNLAVRAASGIASTAHQGNNPNHAAAHGLGFGFGPGGQTKLSRERKHRMREQATQKLFKAYQLDEIACSVATMQSTSSLEEVAGLVLQRSPNDCDAKYVHFFHEKIPSRQLSESTDLTPLNDTISSRPTDPEPLRTRAIVKIFKEDYEGAVMDLTEAIKVNRLYRHTELKPPSTDVQVFDQQRIGRRQDDIILKEEEQPSSLENQLLFQRASVYLTIACRHVNASYPASSKVRTQGDERLGKDSSDSPAEPQSGDEASTEARSEPELTPAEKEAQRKMLEARKLVRLNAKRALRDLMSFVSHFEYSPDLPVEIPEEFTRKVNYTANGVRVPRNTHPHSPRSGSPVTGDSPTAPHRIYALSDLFSAAPPSDLPPYPSMELAPARPLPPPSLVLQTTTETLTFHPLLPDALHSLLLCHCLVQTSAKELLRHAYMVARLARLVDGYPVFQASRSPARADWIEVLRGCSNWIHLAGTWDDLCTPGPLPLFQSSGSSGGASGSVRVSGNKPTTTPSLRQVANSLRALGDEEVDHHSSSTALASCSNSSGTVAAGAGAAAPASASLLAAETDQQRKERIHHQAVFDSLSDDRVIDETSFQLAIRARKIRAEHDYRLDNAVAALDAKLNRRELEDNSSNSGGGDAVQNMIEGVPPAGGSKETPAAEIVETGQEETLERAKNGGGPSSAGTASSDSSSSKALVRTTTTTTTTTAGGTANGKVTTAVANGGSSRPGGGGRRWTTDEAREYQISTDRAAAIARWVNAAPPPSSGSSGGGGGSGGAAEGTTRKKKRRPVKKTTGGGVGSSHLVASETA